MLIGIAIFLTFFLWGLLDGIKDRQVSSIFVGILIGVVLGLFIMAPIALIAGSPPIEDCIVTEHTQYIESLNDNLGTEGHFAIGCGMVKTDMYYYYLEKTEHGLKMNKVEADEVYVREEKNCQPRYTYYRITGFKNWYDYIYRVPLEAINHTLFVPEGTIYRNYNIDLQ